MWRIYKRVLDDLEGGTLSFNETAFINSLLYTDEPGEVELVLQNAVAAVGNEEVKEELLLLKEKLRKKSGLSGWDLS